MDPCLSFLKHKCVTFLTTSNIHLSSSLIKLFNCLIKDLLESIPLEENEIVQDADVRKLTYYLQNYVYGVVLIKDGD